MKTLSAIVTTLFGMLSREGKWTEKQRKFRRDCREEEKEVERMINFMEMNVESIKRAKAIREAAEARVAAIDPDQPRVEALEGLPDEFTGNADPKGDACCYEPKCPCHGVDNV